MKKCISILKAICFYFLSFTWGIILSTVGCVVAMCLLITRHRPHLFYHNIYFEAGDNWEGINLGAFFIISKNSTLQDKQRLSGYGIQNIILGVVTPVIITIPYVLMCLLRKFKTYESKRVFAIILFLVTEAVVMGMCTLGFFINVDLMHVFCCIIIYILPLFIWFLARELPKYQREDVQYERSLVENVAIKLGTKFYK